MAEINTLKMQARQLLQQHCDIWQDIKADPYLMPETQVETQTETPAGMPLAVLSAEQIDERCEELWGEMEKVRRLEMVVAVVGTVKAGKSTAINAIIGTELTPSRNTPMTTVPTLIRHKADAGEPELEFQNPEPLSALIGQIQQLLQQGEDPDLQKQFADYPECRKLLEDIRGGHLRHIRSRAVGSEDIGIILSQVNDLARLTRALGLDFPYSEYNEMHKYPVVSLRFAQLHGLSSEGSLALLDTPGPNEMGHSEALTLCLQEQLARSSAILTVMDYSQINSEADAQMRDEVRSVLGKSHKLEHIYALVNKYDQRTQNDSSEEDLRMHVRQVFGNEPDRPEIFLASGQKAFLASWMQRRLQDGTPILSREGRASEFAERAFGEDWKAEDRLADRAALEQKAERMYQNSGFAVLTEILVRRGYQRAAANALGIAVTKLQGQRQEASHLLLQRKGNLEQLEALEAQEQQRLEQQKAELAQEQQRLEAEWNEALQDQELGQIQQACAKYWEQSCQRLQQRSQELFDFNLVDVYRVSEEKEYRYHLEGGEDGAERRAEELPQSLENKLERQMLLLKRLWQRLGQAGHITQKEMPAHDNYNRYYVNNQLLDHNHPEVQKVFRKIKEGREKQVLRLHLGQIIQSQISFEKGAALRELELAEDSSSVDEGQITLDEAKEQIWQALLKLRDGEAEETLPEFLQFCGWSLKNSQD